VGDVAAVLIVTEWSFLHLFHGFGDTGPVCNILGALVGEHGIW